MFNVIDRITADNYEDFYYDTWQYEKLCKFREEIQEQDPLGKDMGDEDHDDEEEIINLYEVKLYESGVLLDIVFRTIDGDEAFSFYRDPITSLVSEQLNQQKVDDDCFEEKYCEGIEEYRKKDLKFVFLRIPISVFHY